MELLEGLASHKPSDEGQFQKYIALSDHHVSCKFCFLLVQFEIFESNLMLWSVITMMSPKVARSSLGGHNVRTATVSIRRLKGSNRLLNAIVRMEGGFASAILLGPASFSLLAASRASNPASLYPVATDFAKCHYLVWIWREALIKMSSC